MARITDIWLDLDNTLMDFSKGNLDRALNSMKDPEYYKTVVPFEGAMDIFGDLSNDYNICVVSGIPDLKRHGEYLGEMTPQEYAEYFTSVKEYKHRQLQYYFGSHFFMAEEYTKASESKADFIKFRYYDNDNKQFAHTCLLDDLEPYVRTWRKSGGHGIVINEHNPLSVALKTIQEGSYI